MLFSVGDDKKIYVIDVSLSKRVESMLLKRDQRLETKYKKMATFEPGFYVMGYLGIFSFIKLVNKNSKLNYLNFYFRI